MSERRSWIVEKDTTYSNMNLYRCTPVDLVGHSSMSTRVEHASRSLIKSRPPYFVTYEGREVPNTLCECGYYRVRYRGLTRLVHEYNWGDVPWIELIAWGF